MAEKKASPSKRWHLNEVDLQKWGKNVAIFFAPMALLVLIALQQNSTLDEILWIVRLWLLNSMVDLTRKFIATNER